MAKKYENVENIAELLGDKNLGQLSKRLSSTEKSLSEMLKKLSALETEKAEREAQAQAARELEEARAAEAQAAAENNVRRLENPETREIDDRLKSVRAHWYRRIDKIKNLSDFSAGALETYKKEFSTYKARSMEMRQKHKEGKITRAEFFDWLFTQQEKADQLVQSLINEK